MSEKTISTNYANGLIYEMQKAFWDERGRGARFRLTTIGKTFYDEKFRPNIKATEVEGILESVSTLLQQEGIVAQVSYKTEEKLLRIQVEGCLHRQVEEQMKTHGIEPFTCVPANLIVLAIKEKLDRVVELAEIKMEDGHCSILLIVFDKKPETL